MENIKKFFGSLIEFTPDDELILTDVNIWLDQLVQEFELSDEDINKLAQLKDMNGKYLLALSKQDYQQALKENKLGSLVFCTLHDNATVASKRPGDPLEEQPDPMRPRYFDPAVAPSLSLMPPPQFMHSEFAVSTNDKAALKHILNQPLFSHVVWLDVVNHSNCITSIRKDYSKTHGISFNHWKTFDNEMHNFYERSDVKAALEVEYPMPRPVVPVYVSNEASLSSMANETFNSTINLYFRTPENRAKRYIMLKDCNLRDIKPDFWFSSIDLSYRRVAPRAKMPLEIIREDAFSTSNLTLIEYIREFPKNADPIYKLVAYIQNSRSKYGVLTTIAQTWVFKKENDKLYYLSPFQSEENWLKTVFFACWMSKELDANIPSGLLASNSLDTNSNRI